MGNPGLYFAVQIFIAGLTVAHLNFDKYSRILFGANVASVPFVSI